MTFTTDYDRGNRQTHPIVSEGAPHRQNRNRLTVTKIWSRGPRRSLTPSLTGRKPVGRNVTLTSTLKAVSRLSDVGVDG
jgi:hypothetical protein